MSNFVIGNRVRVEFDGTILSFTSHGTVLVQREDGRQHWMHLNHLTKLHDPLPTKNGAMIRLNDETRAVTVLVLQGSGCWLGAGTNYEYSDKRAQEVADAYGFTVLYPGDDV